VSNSVNNSNTIMKNTWYVR